MTKWIFYGTIAQFPCSLKIGSVPTIMLSISSVVVNSNVTESKKLVRIEKNTKKSRSNIPTGALSL